MTSNFTGREIPDLYLPVFAIHPDDDKQVTIIRIGIAIWGLLSVPGADAGELLHHLHEATALLLRVLAHGGVGQFQNL